ncbi:MAG: outer membrane assembly protein AsmA [Serratia symbiotica]|nr:outer membrane assembly protein AsmA [Serratia symbiotica]
MRRLLTALVILLVVLVAGISALVLLVNPNDFRAYMVKKVEQNSGYQLMLSGDLRWHIWPQLSILSGHVTLTAPGAQAPLVSAENMRLDVKLLPLLSHHLFVKQVMLKNSVIRLTPESEEQHPVDAPIAPVEPFVKSVDTPWKLGIDHLRIVDSLLIWQRANNTQINVRDINLTLQQNDQRQVQMALSSRINRDQRDLTLTMAADIDLQHYPRQINAKLTRFNYQLAGADILNGGIKGEGYAQCSYQQTPPHIVFNPVSISANDNQFTGDVTATMAEVPTLVMNLSSANLNLDALSGWQSRTSFKTQVTASAPVIASQIDDQQQDMAELRNFNAQLIMQVDKLTYRGMNITQLAVQADNQRGLLRLHKLSGQLADGHFSFPGSLDVRGDKTIIALQPLLQHVEMGTLLKAFDMPQVMSGKFSMQGELIGDRLTLPASIHSWRGSAQLAMQEGKLHGLNVQQLVQQVVARSDSSVRGQDNYPHYTAVAQLAANASLNQGRVNISEMNAQSPLLSMDGSGTVNMVGKQCDMAINLRVTRGWQGRSDLIEQLQKTSIPLRVYGPWAHLNYQLQVEQILHKTLENRAKKALCNWIEKNKNSREGQDLKKLLDKL